MQIARRYLSIVIAASCCSFVSTAENRAPAAVKSDERVIFFPTAARLSDDGETWIVPVHGWIFEPEEVDLLRGFALRELQDALDLDPNQKAAAIFKKRAGRFLVDNERNKRIVIEIGEETHRLKRSDKDGHFIDTVKIPAATAKEFAKKGKLDFRVQLRPGDPRNFTGTAHLLPAEGISVISDIDDTIKVTKVRDKEKLLENTFLKPFQAIGPMAKVYAKWDKAGVRFHYVSSAPWQLYEPISSCLNDSGFPQASYHLKRIRLKDATFLSLFADPEKTKRLVIEPILKAYPKRKFILIGDSGEKDPEVYGALAEKFPGQIRRIFIRDVTGESEDADRYRRAFDAVPRSLWTIFQKPKSLRLPRGGNVRANGGP